MKTLNRLCRFGEGSPSERAAKVALIFVVLLPLFVIGQSVTAASAAGSGVVFKTVKEKITGHNFQFQIPKNWQRIAKKDEITWRDQTKKRVFSIKLIDVGTTWYKSFRLSPLDYFEQQIRSSFEQAGWTIEKAEMTHATRLSDKSTARIVVLIPATSKRASVRQIYSFLPGGKTYAVVVLVGAPERDFALTKKDIFEPILKSFRLKKQPPPFQ